MNAPQVKVRRIYDEPTDQYRAEIDSTDHGEAVAQLTSLAAAAALITSTEREHLRDIVDEWGEGSFPASDPPANWR